ncbi:MAG: 3-hydroxyacyl-CoA dehydrogenase family protein [Solirubrobacterales bacterium]|nr:3-hydroxyacyl-CoA dehydrogenase family protein [Solirubrobacterales bacterium]
MFVFSIGVVGAGVMGGQIAQAIAAAGELPVVLHDPDPTALERALAEAGDITQRRAARAVEQGRLGDDQAAERIERTLGLLSGTTGYEGFGGVDLVIEAVPESLDVKQEVFAELDVRTPGHAILATNTSGIPVTAIADAVSFERRSKVIGLHFFWPASVMRLVEVVVGEESSPETVASAVAFVSQIRKSPVRCADSPGFVVNRIFAAMNSEAWAEQEATQRPVADVDAELRASGLVPMGPFEVADMIGLDTVVRVDSELRDAYGDAFRVHGGMQELVGQGHLGAKSGRGFYEH